MTLYALAAPGLLQASAGAGGGESSDDAPAATEAPSPGHLFASFGVTRDGRLSGTEGTACACACYDVAPHRSARPVEGGPARWGLHRASWERRALVIPCRAPLEAGRELAVSGAWAYLRR